MNDWTGKRIEIFYQHDSAKIVGICRRVMETGVVIETGDDGFDVEFKVMQSFVPFAAIGHVNLMANRSAAEQDAKRKELVDRFTRLKAEVGGAPTPKQIELLKDIVS